MLISSITLDERVTMDAGKAYGLLVAKSTEVTAVHPLVTAEGASTTVTLKTPVDDAAPTAPAAGDHIVFGELGSEAIRCIVRDIDPSGDLEARITLVPEAPAIHNAGDVLPDFDPGITTPSTTLPSPVVLSVSSDADVMFLTANGTLVPRVVFQLDPAGIDNLSVRIFQRLSDTDQEFSESSVVNFSAREAVVSEIEEGETYDFSLIYTHPEYYASLPSEVNAHFVVGGSGIPSDLTNVIINAIGGNALIRWDKSDDIDVLFGGRIYWRWSPELDVASAVWQESVSIGPRVDGGSTHVYLPLKPGTYLGRVFDAGGLMSDGVAKVSTKQASALTWSPVSEVIEHPGFSGTLTSLVKDGSTIKLGAGLWDDIPDVDALTDVDSAGVGVAVTGTYDFAAGMDFGSVTKVRLTSHIAAVTENIYDFIDDWADLDSREDIDGTSGAPVDAWVEIRQTDDDPTGSPTWGPWERLDASEVEAWGVDPRVVLLSEDRSFNLIVSELSVKAEEVA